jgi:hypothetical protein
MGSGKGFLPLQPKISFSFNRTYTHMVDEKTALIFCKPHHLLGLNSVALKRYPSVILVVPYDTLGVSLLWSSLNQPFRAVFG